MNSSPNISPFLRAKFGVQVPHCFMLYVRLKNRHSQCYRWLDKFNLAQFIAHDLTIMMLPGQMFLPNSIMSAPSNRATYWSHTCIHVRCELAFMSNCIHVDLYASRSTQALEALCSWCERDSVRDGFMVRHRLTRLKELSGCALTLHVTYQCRVISRPIQIRELLIWVAFAGDLLLFCWDPLLLRLQ